ncbi:hypothetical protein B0T13DRAFT_504121 [Neurospora crassa]|nr:hypothetical protein B0T13DRAFT_504121 [Neurospora crassa]
MAMEKEEEREKKTEVSEDWREPSREKSRTECAKSTLAKRGNDRNDCHEGRGKHPLVGQWESAITTSMRDEDWVQKWRHNVSNARPSVDIELYWRLQRAPHAPPAHTQPGQSHIPLSWTGNFDWSRTDPCIETKHGTSPGPSSFIPVHHLGICHLPGINPSLGPDQDDRDDRDLMSTLKRIGRHNEETAPDYA